MKISLRELFLLVVIAAMGCGWWTHEQQRERIAKEREQIAWDWILSPMTSPGVHLNPGQRMEVTRSGETIPVKIVDEYGQTHMEFEEEDIHPGSTGGLLHLYEKEEGDRQHRHSAGWWQPDLACQRESVTTLAHAHEPV